MLGLALRVTVAVCFGLTVTVVDWAALPPVPLQVNEYVEFAESAPVDCEPLTGLLPDHAPEAVQEVAFVADHVRVELLPLITELGLAPEADRGGGRFHGHASRIARRCRRRRCRSRCRLHSRSVRRWTANP